jgi:hypothetical protein
LVQVEIWLLRLEAQDWAVCGKQSPANKTQNHVQFATPQKSVKLHANNFNFKKWPVTASGGNVVGVGGERFYEYVREIAIEILSKKIKIKIFNNYYLIRSFCWKPRAFRAGESKVTCTQ